VGMGGVRDIVSTTTQHTHIYIHIKTTCIRRERYIYCIIGAVGRVEGGRGEEQGLAGAWLLVGVYYVCIQTAFHLLGVIEGLVDAGG
jgi:hypothetical protein